jgi:hypothetical protein
LPPFSSSRIRRLRHSKRRSTATCLMVIAVWTASCHSTSRGKTASVALSQAMRIRTVPRPLLVASLHQRIPASLLHEVPIRAQSACQRSRKSFLGASSQIQRHQRKLQEPLAIMHRKAASAGSAQHSGPDLGPVASGDSACRMIGVGFRAGRKKRLVRNEPLAQQEIFCVVGINLVCPSSQFFAPYRSTISLNQSNFEWKASGAVSLFGSIPRLSILGTRGWIMVCLKMWHIGFWVQLGSALV